MKYSLLIMLTFMFIYINSIGYSGIKENNTNIHMPYIKINLKVNSKTFTAIYIMLK